MTYETYHQLKKKKAQEQGKNFWSEAILTDEEAHLRFIPKKEMTSCNFCRFLKGYIAPQCSLGHHPTDTLCQTCDEWRYFA